MDDEAAEVLESLSSSASLIVIGSHRYGALAGGFVGSVAWFLVGQMNAPLCVVPPESFEPLTATPSASSRPPRSSGTEAVGVPVQATRR